MLGRTLGVPCILCGGFVNVIVVVCMLCAGGVYMCAGQRLSDPEAGQVLAQLWARGCLAAHTRPWHVVWWVG